MINYYGTCIYVQDKHNKTLTVHIIRPFIRSDKNGCVNFETCTLYDVHSFYIISAILVYTIYHVNENSAGKDKSIALIHKFFLY